MAYYIAFGSSNGLNVDLKFGETDHFYIYEVEGLNVSFSEIRHVPSSENALPSDTSASCGTAGSGCGGSGNGCGGNGHGCGGGEAVLGKVSLIEDCRAVVCKKIGFQAETAENGKDAVDILTAAEPGYFDAVLMDIQMPVMNGYEATKLIRSFEDTRKANIPIVAVTANAFGDDVRRAHDAGMNAHIAKPIDPKNLQSVLTDLLFS